MEYTLGLYEKAMPNSLPLAEKLRHTAAAGYDYMELSIDETDEKLARLNWPQAEINALRRAMEGEGAAPIRSICLSGHRRYPLGDPDPAAEAEALSIMQRAVKLAAALGVRVIQIAGYDVYYKPGDEGTRARFGKNLALCTAMAAGHGVTLGFETMETDFLNTVEKAMYWVKKINSPWLQIYPDLGNLTNAALAAGQNVLQDMESGRGHLCALHLKETRPGIFREVPYGEGHVDFEAGATCAIAQGVRMFTGEFWHTGEENWQDILRANNAFLRAAIEKAARAAGV